MGGQTNTGVGTFRNFNQAVPQQQAGTLAAGQYSPMQQNQLSAMNALITQPGWPSWMQPSTQQNIAPTTTQLPQPNLTGPAVQSLLGRK